MIFDTLPLAVRTSNLTITEKSTYKKSMRWAGTHFRVINAQQRTLQIHENGVSSTKFKDRATHGAHSARNASVSWERDGSKGETKAVNNGDLAPVAKVADSEMQSRTKIFLKLKSNVQENEGPRTTNIETIYADRLRKFKDSTVNCDSKRAQRRSRSLRKGDFQAPLQCAGVITMSKG